MAGDLKEEVNWEEEIMKLEPSRELVEHLYRAANEFIRYMREEGQLLQRTNPKSRVARLWKNAIYGAQLGGSVQKRIAMKMNFDGDIVIIALHPGIRSLEDVTNMRADHEDFLLWIDEIVTKKQSMCGELGRYKSTKVPNRNIAIIWDYLEFDVLFTYTFKRIIELEFGWKHKDIHVREFDLTYIDGLQPSLNEELNRYKTYCQHLSLSRRNENEKSFLENKASSCLSLLSVFLSLREERAFQQCVIFMKAWKEYLKKQENTHLCGDSKFVKSIVIELLTAHVCQLLKNFGKQFDGIPTPGHTLSVEKVILGVLSKLIELGSKKSRNEYAFVRWPRDTFHDDQLYRTAENWAKRKKLIYICNPILLQNMEHKFNQWPALKECAKQLKYRMEHDPRSVVRDIITQPLAKYKGPPIPRKIEEKSRIEKPVVMRQRSASSTTESKSSDDDDFDDSAEEHELMVSGARRVMAVKRGHWFSVTEIIKHWPKNCGETPQMEDVRRELQREARKGTDDPIEQNGRNFNSFRLVYT